MRRRVLLIRPMLHKMGEEILGRECELVRPPDASPASVLKYIEGASAAYVRTPGVVNRESMLHSPNLLIVASAGSGVDFIDVEAATELGIVVANSPGVGAEAVAEHALGLIIALSKKIVQSDRFLRNGGRWNAREEELVGHELSGRVLGVVGFGHIGHCLADKCRLALGMSVVAYDPLVEDLQIIASGAQPVKTLAELLQRSHVVSLHLPLSKETKHLIGREQLSGMRRDAILVNTSRGPVVDEEALIEALQKGLLAGAGLDVFEAEPPRPTHPFFAMENVIVTPHLAGLTDESMARLATASAESILAVFNGQRPPNVVNPEVFTSSSCRFRAAPVSPV